MSSTLSLPKKAINKRGPIDDLYLASFKDEEVLVYARSVNAAKQKAVEHFKPKKKETELIHILLKRGFKNE